MKKGNKYMFGHCSTQHLTFFARNHLLAAAACVLGTALPLLADGTKDFFSDQGLYPGNPPGSISMDIYIWSANNQTNVVNALFGTTDAPEGRQVAKTTIDTLWGGWGIFNVLTNDATQTAPLDCSDYRGGALRFWLKSQDELLVEIEYLYHDAPLFHGKVGRTIPSTSNNWVEIVIPLNELPSYPDSPSGLDLGQIIGPFLISTSTGTGTSSAPKTWYVDYVRWTKPVVSLAVFPSSTKVNPGRHRQFVVEGRSVSNEVVSVSTAFTTPSSVGTLVPPGPVVALSSVLTAGQTSGNVTATLADSLTSLSTSVTVEVTGDDLSAQFGIVSDTRANLDLTTNSKLLAFYGGGTPTNIVATESNDVVEGTSSVKTIVYNPTTNGYSGWTVIWGTNSLLETDTKDMSNFYDGSLRFWLKAPSELRRMVTVGIRSGNVVAGKEISKVSLDDYTILDNQWHEVSIPLRVLAGPHPWADLSRIRCFFTITVVGMTSRQQTFLVDDLRWDTETAPPRPNAFRFTAFGKSTSGHDFWLNLEGPAGKPFTINASPNLLDWSPIYDGILASGQLRYVHSNAMSNVRLFYRAVGSQ